MLRSVGLASTECEYDASCDTLADEADVAEMGVPRTSGLPRISGVPGEEGVPSVEKGDVV